MGVLDIIAAELVVDATVVNAEVVDGVVERVVAIVVSVNTVTLTEDEEGDSVIVTIEVDVLSETGEEMLVGSSTTTVVVASEVELLEPETTSVMVVA